MAEAQQRQVSSPAETPHASTPRRLEHLPGETDKPGSRAVGATFKGAPQHFVIKIVGNLKSLMG